MKWIMVTLIATLFSVSSYANSAPKAKKCPKNKTLVSCQDVKGAKRVAFCAKKKVSDKTKARVCKMKPKHKRKNKVTKLK